jgi:hypothetical protein
MTNDQLMQIGYKVTERYFASEGKHVGKPYWQASYNGADIGTANNPDWAWDLCHDAHKQACRVLGIGYAWNEGNVRAILKTIGGRTS